MLVSTTMEVTPSVTAAENMANRLADRIRNIWLYHQSAKDTAWEENFFEDPDGIAFLRSESFPNLVGMDYIFKWWGGKRDIDDLAGELEVLWKVSCSSGGVKILKTWIRFGDRDFIMGNVSSESGKREANRAQFREAFAGWQQLYLQLISTL